MQLISKNLQPNSGVTFVELVMAITLVAVLASATSYFIGNQVVGQRYEATRAKMEKIREAILGNPGVDNEGRRTNFGYMGDMGKFPATLTNLTTIGSQTAWAFDSTLGMGAGWRGPYYSVIFSGEDSVANDAWGTALVYSTAGVITSYGANRVSGGTGFDSDLTYNLTTSPHRASVYGYVADGEVRLSSKTVVAYYPANGAITSLSGTTDTTGAFTLANIPFGIRAFKVTSTPTIGPKTFTVDKSSFMLPYTALNYSSSAGIVVDGLVLLLDASNNAGTGYSASASTWKDLSGNANNGTLTNFGSTASSGWNGNGTAADPYRLVFDGTDDYATISHNSTIDPPFISICAWIRKSDVTGLYHMIATKEIDPSVWATTPTGWELRFYSTFGQPHFVVAVGTTWVHQGLAVPTLTASNNTWTFVSGTYDGSTLKFQMNGAQSASASITGQVTDDISNILIGRRSDGYFFNGDIAQIAIYNRALNATEIAQNCYAGKARFSGATCP